MWCAVVTEIYRALTFFWHSATTRPVKSIDKIVPIPIPIRRLTDNRPMQTDKKRQEKSKRFLPNPNPFFSLIPSTFARPSAGFGRSFIPTVKEAPIPVKVTANTNKTNLTIRFCALGRSRSNISMNKLVIRLKGICSHWTGLNFFPNRRNWINTRML